VQNSARMRSSHPLVRVAWEKFLEGQTLADRLRSGPLALAEVYRIGIALAEPAKSGSCLEMGAARGFRAL
jgi:hypothetical protein